MKWKLDPAHSTVDFTVRYLVSSIHGRFTGMRGGFELEEAADGAVPEPKQLALSFAVTSFNTGVPLRDRNILSDQFLDGANFPLGTVRFTDVVKDVAPTYLMAVELTLHGVTRVVDVVVNLAGPVTDDRTGLRRFGATAVGQLRRSDFGVDAWLGGIADLVDFTVNVQAVPASVPDDQLPPAE
jgi:polyisoprenoid-binding protein YceI